MDQLLIIQGKIRSLPLPGNFKAVMMEDINHALVNLIIRWVMTGGDCHAIMSPVSLHSEHHHWVGVTFSMR